MRIHHNSLSTTYRKPFGCLQEQQDCQLRIDIPRHCNATSAFFVLEDHKATTVMRLPMVASTSDDDRYDCYRLTFDLPECGLYYYYFHIESTDGNFDLFRQGLTDTNISVGDKWQITCYHAGYDTADCFKGKVMYQIFPDRFYKQGDCNLTGKLEPYWVHEDVHDCPVFLPDEQGIIQNNDFFGGNLQGVIAKLPYLASLHVGILYLNPIFKAYSNHRYDAADYKTIDPMLGTREDLTELCDKAHALGIKVLLDGVFSHTGCNSVYFDRYNLFGNGVYHNPDSPYRSWFQFHSPTSQEYTSWWGIDTLPCVEELSDGFLDYIIRDEDSVLSYWMDCGVDGYRLDVADELPDQFIALLHERVHQKKEDSLVLGEVWEDASNKIAYSVRRRYFADRELDSVMNYPYKDAIIGFVTEHWTAKQLETTVMQIAEHYPKPILDCLMNSLSTHDTMRILTVLGTETFPETRTEKSTTTLSDEELTLAIERLNAAMFLQFFLPGCPCIYYGDEVGLEGFEDPFNRRYFPWDAQNEVILSITRALCELKSTHSPLQIGDIRVLSSDQDVFVFERTTGEKRLIGMVSLQDQYHLYTNYKTLFLANGTQTDDQITIKKYGCILLDASK